MYNFSKSKLRPGQSFPLKRSVLDAALQEHGIAEVFCVYYFARTGGDIVLRADYMGESQRGWAAAGYTSITIYAVPSAERRATEQMLLEGGLTTLCQWVRAADQRGSGWRASTHALVFHYAPGQLRIEEH